MNVGVYAGGSVPPCIRLVNKERTLDRQLVSHRTDKKEVQGNFVRELMPIVDDAADTG